MPLTRVHDYKKLPGGRVKLEGIRPIVKVSTHGESSINFQNGAAYYDNGVRCDDVPKWALDQLKLVHPNKLEAIGLPEAKMPSKKYNKAKQDQNSTGNTDEESADGDSSEEG